MNSRSIAWRLSAMFAGVALLIFALVGLALQGVLHSELERQQRSELETKARFGEQLIEHCKTPDKWHFVQARFDGLIAGQNSTQFWVLSDDPRFTYGERDALVALKALPDGDGFGDDGRRHWPMRSLARTIAADEQRPVVRLIVATDPSPYRHTLRTFAIALTVLSALGVLLAAMLGQWVARLGLAPLARLSREAQQLSPRQLSQRLRPASLPHELSELTRSFNGALDRLEHAYLQLQAFNADVAHELRTPLTNLIGQTEVALAKPRSADDFADVLHSNLEELDRLRGIINDMLFLARADQGERAEQRQPSSLADEVGKAIDFMDVVLDEAGLHVRIDGDARIGIDTSLFRRAITNLLQNAIQHSAAGAEITVTITANAAGTRVVVANPGAPIPDSHLGRLFERFYRADPSRGSAAANHGLGLAIVKAVAQMHGGIVFAESRDGINTFGFTLSEQAPS